MTLLATRGLTAGYGDFQALFGVDMDVADGETVAIIGANGAGKSTLLRTITGLLPAKPASVVFNGQAIGGHPASRIMRLGIAMVPEGRRLFPSLSVEENLQIGADRSPRLARQADASWNLTAVYGLFPVLRERRFQPATELSGGQQQMVAIGRALMSNPALLLCDEISLGLAPIVINDIYAALGRIAEGGVSLVIVEQDIARALQIASRVYCLQEGRVTLAGRPDELSRDAIQAAYFGARRP